MPSISAKPLLSEFTASSFHKLHREGGRFIAILSYSGVNLLDISGPAQVFAEISLARRDTGSQVHLICVSQDGGMIATDTGIEINTASFSSVASLEFETIIVPGGPGIWNTIEGGHSVRWLKGQTQNARRVASVCIGAFLLGSAGLLDHRAAVTHWRYCDQLAIEFPLSDVHRDKLFQKDGQIWSSAGVSAGIDLALAIVEEDFGHLTALEIAKGLVVFLKRPGGQNQFSTLLKAQISGFDQRIDLLHSWIAERLDDNLSVEQLAVKSGMSLRNFSRFYRSVTGMSPAVSIELIRLEAAQMLLQSTNLPISGVAEKVGFGDDERMRRAFQRRLGISPAVFRDRFSAHQF